MPGVGNKMVRFDTTADDAKPGVSRKPAPNYFSRAQQYRLLSMVFTLLLVLFLMAEAAKPKNWQWMWQIAGGQAADTAENRSDTIQAVPWGDNAENDSADIDTRLPERGTHPPGVFLSEADDVSSTDSDDVGVNQEIARDAEPNGLYPGITTDQLGPIRDDTVFRSAESETWFRWCKIIRDESARKDSATSETAAFVNSDVPSVTFLQLFRQPSEYRGRAVRVSGIVRRAHPVSARPNEEGIQGYHRCWLFPANGSNNPVVVYALRMPEGFPTGMELHEEVSFIGVFFKRWAYQAQGGIMTAPLVLSADVVWTPGVPPPPIRTPSLPWIVTAIGLAALLGAGIAWAVYRQSNTQNAHVRRSRERDLPDKAPDLAGTVDPMGRSNAMSQASLSIYEHDEGQRESE